MLRQLKLSATGYTIRKVTFEGRDHYAIPVVALTEGVVFAMNAEAPELVTAEAFADTPPSWNGRPVYHGHPIDGDGDPVSGNLPEVLESKRIGIVFNALTKKRKLVMEAWVDVERCREIAPDLLLRIEEGADIEISIGGFIELDTNAVGVYAGKEYAGEWTGLLPDHLALLPEGTTGACSRKAGCGVRAAKENDMKFDTPADVAASIAKCDTDEGRKLIVAAAYKQGLEFVNALPEGWRKRTDANGSVLGRIMAGLRSMLSPNEMSDSKLREKLYTALRAVEPNLDWVIEWGPITDPTWVVYQVYMPYGYQTAQPTCCYRRTFELDKKGVVTLGDAEMVEAVTEYRPLRTNPKGEDGRYENKGGNKAEDLLEKIDEPATPVVAANTDTGAPCSCKTHEAPSTNEGKDETMKDLKDVMTAFQGADEASKEAFLKALGVKKEEPAAPATPAALATPAAPTVAAETPAAPKAVTLKDLLEQADPDVRDAFQANVRAASEKKASTIKALKATGRCPYNDDELGKMNQADLDRLVTLSGAKQTAARAAVDFSGLGEARGDQPTEQTEAPAAPDMRAAILSNRGQKADAQ